MVLLCINGVAFSLMMALDCCSTSVFALKNSKYRSRIIQQVFVIIFPMLCTYNSLLMLKQYNFGGFQRTLKKRKKRLLKTFGNSTHQVFKDNFFSPKNHDGGLLPS